MQQREHDVERVTDEECWVRLRGEVYGRLALGSGLDLDVFPINYGIDGTSLFFRTAAGTKLGELSVSSWAVFEIDGQTDETAWSVVARGRAHHLSGFAELDVAREVAFPTWLPTPTPDLVRLDVERVSGLRFTKAVQT